ncbi:MAG: triose-phosphate isomerase, partial [Acetobacteraceae bacterium]
MVQLIAGNWKMNGLSAEAEALAGAVRAGVTGGAGGISCRLVLCPPFTLLAPVGSLLAGSGIGLGGQDCHPEPAGAHTGDISAPMLADIGASHVILGHSERRQDHGESDALVRAKVRAALAAGLAPIVCVGESEAQRRAGQAEEVVGGQLAASLPDGFAGLIAYEPVWAIGTGLTPTAAEIAAMHDFLRNRLVERFGVGGREIAILYGGSVKPANAGTILALDEVGGALVGGACLQAADFLAIA